MSKPVMDSDFVSLFPCLTFRCVRERRLWGGLDSSSLATQESLRACVVRALHDDHDGRVPCVVCLVRALRSDHASRVPRVVYVVRRPCRPCSPSQIFSMDSYLSAFITALCPRSSSSVPTATTDKSRAGAATSTGRCDGDQYPAPACRCDAPQPPLVS